jgi:hypothetical protein
MYPLNLLYAIGTSGFISGAHELMESREHIGNIVLEVGKR